MGQLPELRNRGGQRRETRTVHDLYGIHVGEQSVEITREGGHGGIDHLYDPNDARVNYGIGILAGRIDEVVEGFARIVHAVAEEYRVTIRLGSARRGRRGA